MLNRGEEQDIVFSLEKNRLGPTGQTFQLSLHGEFFAFGTTSNSSEHDEGRH